MVLKASSASSVDDFIHLSCGAVADYIYQELKIRPIEDYVLRSITDTPRCVAMAIVVNPTYVQRLRGMEEQLSYAIGLSRGQSVRIGRGLGGALTVEVPKPQNWWFDIGLDALPRRSGDGKKVAIGIDVDIRPTYIDFANPITPHLLAAGATGAGKTSVLRLILFLLVTQNVPAKVRVVLIDGKKRGVDWRDFGGVPHLLHPIVGDHQEALKVLMWASSEISRRAEQDDSRGAVFVFIDELQALLDKQTCPVSGEIQALLRDIAATGRQFNVHCVVGLQNPTAEHMGGTAGLKHHFVARLVGRVDGANAAAAATDQKQSGANTLTGAGDLLLVEPSIGIQRLTAAYLQRGDLERLPRSDQQDHLDLDRVEDVERVKIEERVSKADPLEMEHLALALVAERGNTWLKNTLHIGSTKAARILDDAAKLREELRRLGNYYSIADPKLPIPSIPVIPADGNWRRYAQKRHYPGIVGYWDRDKR